MAFLKIYQIRSRNSEKNVKGSSMTNFKDFLNKFQKKKLKNEIIFEQVQNLVTNFRDSSWRNFEKKSVVDFSMCFFVEFYRTCFRFSPGSQSKLYLDMLKAFLKTQPIEDFLENKNQTNQYGHF